MDEKLLIELMGKMMDEKLQVVMKVVDEKLQEMNGKFQDVYEKLQEMNEKIEPIKNDLRKVRIAQDNEIRPHIKLLLEGQAGVKEKFAKLDDMEKTLEDVKSDVEVIKEVVTGHSQAIRKLKAAK